MIKTFSINYISCHDEWLLAALSDAGFSGIDMEYNDSFFEGDGYEKNAEKLVELLDKYNLKCVQVHFPVYNIFESSEVKDEKKEQDIKDAIRAMPLLGAKWGALHPMSASNFGFNVNRAMEDNIERIKTYLEVASKYDVGIALENLAVFPDCPQYNFFTSDYRDHCEIVDRINSENFGICWDFGHSNLMKYDHKQALKYIGDRIKIVHIHDNIGLCDMHSCPGTGRIKWEELMPVLKENGFKGPLTLEVAHSYPHMAIKKDYLNMCGKMADVLAEML